MIALACALACLALTPVALPHGAPIPNTPGGGFPPPPPASPSPPPPRPEPSAPPASGPPSGPNMPGSAGPGPVSGVPTGARNPGLVATGGDLGPDTGSWAMWWHYNRDAFLDLKEHVEANSPVTGDDAAAPGSARTTRGIDAMVTALGRERNRDLMSSLLVGLARSCDDLALARGPGMAQLFAPFLSDPDQEVAETAAAALGILRHEAALPDLVALLHDDAAGRKLAGGERVPTRTRAFAAYALGLAASRSEREDFQAFVAHHLQRALEAAVDARSADLPAACVLALGLVPLPLELRQAPKTGNARRSDDGLAPRTRASQVALLVDLLRDTHLQDRVRAHVPDALARLAQGASPDLRADVIQEITALLDRAGRESTEVLRGAVLALGRLGDADGDAADLRVRAALKRSADSSDLQTRLFALVSLAQVATRVGSTEDATAVQNEVQKLLLERFGRGRNRERSWAALSLGILEHGRLAQGHAASNAVRAALRRELAECTAPEQVGAIAIALGLAHDLGAVRGLLAQLDELRDPIGRGHVATALGLLGLSEAIPPLRAILVKSRYQPELLRETAIALAMLGDDDLVSTLTDDLRQAKSLASQASVARALGFAGGLNAVEPLARMLEDRTLTAGARGFAAVALGMVCDRERVPWNARLSVGVNYLAAPATLIDGSAGILDIL